MLPIEENNAEMTDIINKDESSHLNLQSMSNQNESTNATTDEDPDENFTLIRKRSNSDCSENENNTYLHSMKDVKSDDSYYIMSNNSNSLTDGENDGENDDSKSTNDQGSPKSGENDTQHNTSSASELIGLNSSPLSNAQSTGSHSITDSDDCKQRLDTGMDDEDEDDCNDEDSDYGNENRDQGGSLKSPFMKSHNNNNFEYSSDADGMSEGKSFNCEISDGLTPDNRIEFTCKKCGRTLSSASSLDRHDRVHSGERPFRCHYCESLFTTNGNMHRHERNKHIMKMNNNNYIDTSFQFQRNVSLKRKLFESVTNDGNNNDQEAEQYNKQAKQTTFPNCCPVCKQSFSTSISLLEDHIKQQHPDFQAKCEECDEIFLTYGLLLTHKEFRHLNNQHSFKIFQQISQKIENSQMYECNFCNENFEGKHFLDHWKCCKSFTKSSSLFKLFAGYDDSLSKVTEQNKQSTSEINSCSKLKEALSSSRIDDDRKPTIYERIGTGVADKKNYGRIPDLINIHTVGAIGTSLLGGLNSLDEKSEVSDEDDRFKAEVRDMKRRGEFPCRICKKIFRNLRALKGHARIHISGNRGNNPFECNICSFTTSDKSVIIGHIRNHNGDHPFKCQLCSSTFTTKANCERHLRNAHRKTSREDIKRLLVDLSSKLQNNNNNNNNTNANANAKHHTENTNTRPRISTSLFKNNELLKKHLGVRIMTDENGYIASESRAYTTKFTSLDTTPNNSGVEISENSDENSETDDLIDMTLPSKENINSWSSVKACNDHIFGNSAFNSTIIQDNGVIRVGNYSSKFELFHDPNDKPLDLTVNVLDLSKKDDHKERRNDQNRIVPQDLSMKSDEQIMAHKYREICKTPMNNISGAGCISMTQTLALTEGIDYRTNQFTNNNTPITRLLPTYLFPSVIKTNIFHPSINLKYDKENANSCADEVYRNIPLNSETKPLLLSHLTGEIISNSNKEIVIKEEPVDNDDLINDGDNTTEYSPGNSRDNLNKINFNDDSSASSKYRPKLSTVRMIMKDGILVEKQKQRRYRTEKPFSCSFCSGRFTLRSNMDRHVKQQHPAFWRQRQRGGAGRTRSNGQKVLDNTDESDINKTIVKEVEMNSTELEISEKYKDQKEYDASSRLSKTESQEEKLEYIDEHSYDNDLVIDEEPRDHTSNIPDEEIDNNDESNEERNEEKNASESHEENQDLASVRMLLDNVSAQTFSQYFHSDEDQVGRHDDGSEDEEGLIAGSSSEGNGSGGEENRNFVESNNNDGLNVQEVKKKKSAYSSAPNRVHCDFCYRSFPWASSLRRHTLTHTGQKPYKCASCPLLFTTKSNCDRHFIRKHRTQMNTDQPSTIVTNNDATGLSNRTVPERPFKCNQCPSSSFSTFNNLEKHILEKHSPNEKSNESGTRVNLVVTKDDESQFPTKQTDKPPVNTLDLYNKVNTNTEQSVVNHIVVSDLPFKCHLCDHSFAERQEALDHIRQSHYTEFHHLICKGALDTNAKPEDHIDETNAINTDESTEQVRGRFPDYSSRKVICAFCLRRFWSAEDLRRHMRTHTGERPFSCDICQRRFTLKHSMLRHRKKHSDQIQSNFASNSEDEEPTSPSVVLQERKSSPTTGDTKNTNKTENFESESTVTQGSSENNASKSGKQNVKEDGVDLIAKLLDIDDKSLVDEMLSSKSADDVAKLLGVSK